MSRDDSVEVFSDCDQVRHEDAPKEGEDIEAQDIDQEQYPEDEQAEDQRPLFEVPEAQSKGKYDGAKDERDQPHDKQASRDNPKSEIDPRVMESHHE